MYRNLERAIISKIQFKPHGTKVVSAALITKPAEILSAGTKFTYVHNFTFVLDYAVCNLV